jgi:hypothetical protein
LDLLKESPERDARELQLLQSLYLVLLVTRGWAAPETVATAERAAMLAEKRGNLRQLIGSMITRCGQTYLAGELRMAGALARTRRLSSLNANIAPPCSQSCTISKY